MTGQKQSDDIRQPIIFTSEYRQRLYTRGANPSPQVELGASRVNDRDLDVVGLSRPDVVMTNIEMMINPSSIRWEQPKRITKRDTREGSVFFHFTNSRGQNNDVLTLRFEGSTGNIDMRGASETGAFRKWLVWHNLYLLSREPILLSDGTENLVRITYMSPLWPSPMDFYGFFEAVLEFAETGDKPNSRDYSFSFKVMYSVPELDDVLTSMTTALPQAFSGRSTVSDGDEIARAYNPTQAEVDRSVLFANDALWDGRGPEGTY